MNDEDKTTADNDDGSPRSEGDAAEDYPRKGQPERERFGLFAEKYTPRHRAPGRASLIRRRRGKDGESEIVSWETSWAEEPSKPDPTPTAGDSGDASTEGGYLDATRREVQKEREQEAAAAEQEEAPSAEERLSAHLDEMARSSGRAAAREQSAATPTTQTPPLNEAAATPGQPLRDLTPPRGRQAGPIPESSVQDDDALDTPSETPRPAGGVPDQITALLSQAAASLEQAGSVPVPRPTEEPARGEPPSSGVEPTEPTPATEPVETAGSPAAAETSPTAQPIQSRPPVSNPAPVAGPTSQRVTTPTPVPAPAARPPVHRPPDRTIVSGSAASRADALQQRRKKQRALWTAGGVGALLVAVAVVVVAGLLVKNAVEPDRDEGEQPAGPVASKGFGGTTLLFGTKENAGTGRGAVWMTLLSVDPSTGRGSIVSVPPHTGVEVPGRGLQGVGDAYASGGVPLLLVSAENLFGINIDRYLELSDRDARVLFEQMGTLTVDVPAEVRVPVGKGGDQARLVFVEGPQSLSPNLLVKLLYTLGIGGDDLELGSRHLAFWDALLTAYPDGESLGDLFEEAGGALAESDASPDQHAKFLTALADVAPQDLTLTTLPVRSISAAETQLYAVDEQELAAFVEETIGVGSDPGQDVRVQILNGNGVPGIGQEVAKSLVGEGFRLILGGNAPRLDYEKTLVVTYENSERGIALAERARDLIGVGEVQISTQQQGIVDLTIVVGKDFLRAP